MTASPTYVGRFAPSPTGKLHLGSLFSALASYLDARAHQGQWRVRMEDLDPPREQPGAAQSILDTLERFGLEWDDNVWFQSQRSAQYESAIEQLLENGQAFFCTCSRKQIAESGGHHHSACCRSNRPPLPPPDRPYAIRVQVNDTPVQFLDRLQGQQIANLNQMGGDFVIKRKEGLYAYHLAVTIDDAAQGITHVVRGCDLLTSTFCHRHLQAILALPSPTYAHVPILINEQGQKLSKQNLAAPIDQIPPISGLLLCLHLMGLTPPKTLKNGPLQMLLEWATEEWTLSRLHPAVQSLRLSDQAAETLQPEAS